MTIRPRRPKIAQSRIGRGAIGNETPAFQLDRVSKRYGNRAAVDNLTLEIPAGRSAVLIGPSGCGKSTLLRLLIGLIRPDGGEIRFEGSPLRPETLLETRRKMGYVIQDGGLFPHLTARGNAVIMAEYLGWGRDRMDARLEELADLTHFPPDGLDRFPAELSGGQRQRVSLMRALMLDPDVLLLDEPLGALDPMIRASLQTELRDIVRQLGKTVVMVTHDLAEAVYFGDQLVLMREGRVVQQGPFGELLGNPADGFATRFIQAQRSLSDHLRDGNGANRP